MWYTFQSPLIKSAFGVGKLWGTKKGGIVVLHVPYKCSDGTIWFYEEYKRENVKPVPKIK